MTPQNLSYFVFELFVLLGVGLVAHSLGIVYTVATRRFITVAAALYVFWVVLDVIAVRMGVFVFPARGNLPIRVLGLPLEEHLFFIVHVVAIWIVVLVADAAKPIGE